MLIDLGSNAQEPGYGAEQLSPHSIWYCEVYYYESTGILNTTVVSDLGHHLNLKDGEAQAATSGNMREAR